MDTVPTDYSVEVFLFLGVNQINHSGHRWGAPAFRKFSYFSRHNGIEEYDYGEPVMDIVLHIT